MSTPKDPNVITLKGRLSYPCLNVAELEHKKKRDAKKGTSVQSSFGATLILDKKQNAAEIEKVKTVLRQVAAAQWPDKTIMVKGQAEKLVVSSNPKAEKLVLLGTCLHDGEEKADKDGFGDHVMFVSSSRKEKDGPPRIMDKSLQHEIQPQESHYPYGGCYVHASIRLWAQDNEYGKRINAETRVIIFDKHGEPFGAGAVDAESDFAGVDLDDDAETPAPAAKQAAAADEWD